MLNERFVAFGLRLIVLTLVGTAVCPGSMLRFVRLERSLERLFFCHNIPCIFFCGSHRANRLANEFSSSIYPFCMPAC